MWSMNHFLHQSNKLRFWKVFNWEEIIDFIEDIEEEEELEKMKKEYNENSDSFADTKEQV